MDRPIKAEIFLVSVEDHGEALKELDKTNTPYATFPHHSGDYMAIAVGTGSKKKQPPPVPPFQGGE